MTDFVHLPVMATEVLEHLAPQRGDVFADGTVGLGGHSALIAPYLGAAGQLFACDRDATALALAQTKLATAPCATCFFHTSYEHLPAALAATGAAVVQRLLLDLGVSSMQFDDAARGFSFRHAAPLDMRLDTTQTLTAAHVVNTYAESELADLFFYYGEERFARRMAKRIGEFRQKNPITTTVALADLLATVAPRHGKIHPATRVFQALRIAVNDELGTLARALPRLVTCLAPHGRLVVLTFHSLEDRLVKHYFRALAEQKIATLPRRKALAVSAAEIAVNRRARSAKLRVLEKLATEKVLPAAAAPFANA